jgi:AcrR family transcriptional regulator
MDLTPAKTARERVLEVAGELFYREGVRAVGIDTIIARSGVAKMSLYRNFASKDELIVAYLEERDRQFFSRWDEAVGSTDLDPRARLRALVGATIERVRRPGYRGCPFLNTSAEFPDAAHPARAIIDAHRREVRERLLGLCRGLDSQHAESLTTQLIVLMDGVYASAGSLDDPAAAALMSAAEVLIEAQFTRSRKRSSSPGSAAG